MPRLFYFKHWINNISKHFLFQLGIKLNAFENRGIKAQIFNADGIDTAHKIFHMELFYHFIQPLPINFICVFLHKEGPIKNLPQIDVCTREVRYSMFNQKQGMQIGRWQIHLRSIILDIIFIILAQFLEYFLHFSTGPTSMNIYKVIMILHYEISPVEYGMVVMRSIYLYTLLLIQSGIRFFLLSKLPDVNIPTRSVLRFGPI